MSRFKGSATAGEKLIRAHAGESAAIIGQIEREFGAEKLELLLDLLEGLQSLDLRQKRQD